MNACSKGYFFQSIRSLMHVLARGNLARLKGSRTDGFSSCQKCIVTRPSFDFNKAENDL